MSGETSRAPARIRPYEWDRMSFVWDLWYRCNYRCSYCWWEMGKLWETMAQRDNDVPPPVWIEAWGRLYERYGTARINLVGGEPLLYPGFEELVEGLTRQHMVMVTTNLSLPLERLRRIARNVDPARLHLEASFHPEFAKLDELLERLEVFRQAGFEPWATIVAWPAFVEQLGGWVRRLRGAEVRTSVQVFTGVREGLQYPQAYTPVEVALIREWLPSLLTEQYGLGYASPLGKPCGSGAVFGVVDGRGVMKRCGTIQEPMGNILDPGFRLSDGPAPCPASVCRCNEYRYLWEEYIRRHPGPLAYLKYPAEKR